MRRIAVVLAAILVALVSSPTSTARSSHPRQLTFKDRVRAQEAIERVYYSHQKEVTKRFEDVIHRDAIVAKVSRYLKQTVMLEERWKTTVTTEMLERELERMARGTRMPERLHELIATLDNDPLLILECVVRPVLVDRLARNFFAGDQRIHSEARIAAESLHDRLLGGASDAGAENVHRTEVELVRSDETLGKPSQPSRRGDTSKPARARLELGTEEFDRWLARAPTRLGEIGSIEETLDAFTIQVLLERKQDQAVLAVHSIEKQTFDAWWQAVSSAFDDKVVGTVGPLSESFIMPKPSAGATESLTTSGIPLNLPCDPGDEWSGLPTTYLPADRYEHSAVWTGTEMIIWGGTVPSGSSTDSGGRYDPALDIWHSTSRLNAPLASSRHAAVWTGTEMVVFGGNTYRSGRYDPSTDTWRPTSMVDAPNVAVPMTAVWTGSQMVVWGGGGGGRYDPVTDVWRSVTLTNAPLARTEHIAVWTGTRMIVWGGYQDTFGLMYDGASYDPHHDQWLPISGYQAPSARLSHSAVWTGSRMIVWGGRDGSTTLNTGAQYDPVSDTWTPTSTINAPARYRATAVWTGSEMVTYGGFAGVATPQSMGSRYDPAQDTWTPISLLNAPNLSMPTTSVWTGSLIIASAGTTGGRYDPSTDSWTPTSTFVLEPRAHHAAVWTGNLALIWGGYNSGPSPTLGARYDPILDYWAPISSLNAPRSSSYGVSAVWSGTEMIVWGGWYDNTGGRYNPVSDTWRPTTVLNAPAGRHDPAAFWTGSRMIIWGGAVLGYPPASGGIYDPVLDTWAEISSVGAPLTIGSSSAIWTGSEMILWGGYETNEGYRYSPASDTWRTISSLGAPEPRTNHKAVWTGREMLVWGGLRGSTYLNSGGRYDPVADAWRSISSTGAPEPRLGHTATWTGSLMVIWGGQNAAFKLSTGGRYHPLVDAWVPTSNVNTPFARALHTALWIDDLLMIWGGEIGCCTPTKSGGLYRPDFSPDADDDKVSVCFGDCDESRPAVYPGAPQICDGLNNDCNHPQWPDLTGTTETDDDGDTMSECLGDCNDSAPAIHPGATEPCDGIDNNCDGRVDELFDLDSDGSTTCAGDCDDGDARVFPGAAPTCDGVNNDCGNASWPSLSGTNEADDDLDGTSECQGDCDDGEPATHLSAIEVNDWADNQCPGETGYGVRDEISDDAGFDNTAAPHVFCWPEQSGATAYLVARAADPHFTTDCRRFDLSTSCLSDAEVPASNTIFYYLVRADAPWAGSWGKNSAGAERIDVCTSPAASFGFTDTSGDDITNNTLGDFFSSVNASAADYIFFEVAGSPTGGAWCSERADFYRESYLALASGGATISSGPWHKWYRDGSGHWSGPTTASFLNYYGTTCYESWSWCGEYGLGGLLLDVRPAGPGFCEIMDDQSACGAGNWQLSIRISNDRRWACGF